MKYLALISLLLICSCAGPGRAAKAEDAAMKHVNFSGGSGDSHETAVVVEGAKTQVAVMKAEYYYISKEKGVRDKAWRLVGQTLEREGTRVFDVLEIEDKSSGGHAFYYFDLSRSSWTPRIK